MSNIVSNFQANYLAKHKAFPYQNEAFRFIKDLNYGAIFHEQGLGKTKIAIDLSLYWLEKRNIDTVLIVAKKQLVKNWLDEYKFHSHIQPVVLNNDRNNNFYVLNGISKIIVTNFETIEVEKERLSLFLKSRDVAVIIDESAKLKNPTSKITITFFELSSLFKIKVIMTGTPIANRPYDIWSQIYFLDHGNSLGADFNKFKKQTNLSNKLNSSIDEKNTFEETLSGIFSKISSFSIRETKKSCGIELPDKIYETVFCDFELRQKSMYDEVVNTYKLEIQKNGDKLLDNSDDCLKRLLRLNQICSNPYLVDDTYNAISAKELKLDLLIKQILSRNEKCIVWSSFIENIDIFTRKYKNYGSVKIHGSMTIEDRNLSVKKFKENEEVKLLFATPQAAKEGLTLTVANNAIFYDRSFNLDDYLQAQDRIHRISQKKKCYIYKLQIKNTIDDWIDALLTAKQQAAALAQGDITRYEYDQIADYSYADIIRSILKEENYNE